MSTVTTMSQPPPPKGGTTRPPKPPGGPPPPSRSNNTTKSNTVNAKRRPPPPPPPTNRRPPPPPGPPTNSRNAPRRPNAPPAPLTIKRPGPPTSSSSSSSSARTGIHKRPAPPPPSSDRTMKNVKRKFGISIKKPVALRDVHVFARKHQLGQGTFGSVFMGADKETGEVVALKRINTEQEANGFPITAIREVKILKALDHPNVIKLREIVTSKEQGSIPNKVFLVFEYMEYDLTGILETSEIRLSHDHIKSWAHQLLKGVHYMHVNSILHRDLKSSNLLIDKNGVLKIADWGLARSWNPRMKHLTNGVITLWYRPTELLLGAKEYSTKIDMWSVGCILAEMFRRSGLLRGGTEAHQLQLIFDVVGHPSVEDWPGIYRQCPLWKNHEPRPADKKKSNLKQVLKSRLPQSQASWMTNSAVELISNLLTHNPDKRWDALKCIGADYFYENPIVKTADKLQMRLAVDTVHEWSARKKHQARAKAQRSHAAAAAGNGMRG